MENQRQQEIAVAESERAERIRLESLRQKSLKNQSAVASPEVKRHLQDFLKRKEAAASMSNLKMVPATPNTTQFTGRSDSQNEGEIGQNPTNVASSGASSSHGAILRKTASESNLLKMKHGKRSLRMSEERNGPYSRLMAGGGGANPLLGVSGREPSIPETSAITIATPSAVTDHDSLQGSPGSNHSASSLCSMPGGSGIPIFSTKSSNQCTTRPPLVRDLSLTSAAEQYTGSSAPNSPKVINSLDTVFIYFKFNIEIKCFIFCCIKYIHSSTATTHYAWVTSWTWSSCGE